MRTLDIGLDIDNVLYPWSTVFTRWVEQRKGLPPGTLDDIALSWTWYKDQWGMETSEFMEHYTSGVHAGVIFAHGDPDPGSVAAVRRLHLDGHRIHYVTNREVPGVTHGHAWQATHRWLHEHGFVVDSLTVSEDKSLVQTDVFLDDSPANIESLLRSGHPLPLLWDRPHNTGSVPCIARRCSGRVRDWRAFEQIVRAIAHAPTLDGQNQGSMSA